jgi:SAM-dependent methyltransferase
MAAEVGEEGRVVGVERDAAQIAEARRLAAGDDIRVEIREGNAYELPLADAEWGSFDVAHARFLLEHLPDPLPVVRAMLRAVKPGGRVVLVDDDHEVLRLTPEPPGFGPLWRAYTRQFDRVGNDPYIGRRLVSLLHEAGAERFRNTSLFFGGCAGQVTFPDLVENLTGVLRGARDPIVRGGMMTATEFDDGVTAVRTWAARPDAAAWYTAEWAQGHRPRPR